MSRRAWTPENLRHLASLVRQGRNPAATVYESLGPDFFLALDEGWLNLGLWEGDGSDPDEAPAAVRRLVVRIGDRLAGGGGALDPVIARERKPRSLTALNVTLAQLVAGRERLAEAHARPVNGDATRMPFADTSFDGVISVEAAFHFPSRDRFFAEAWRVLRPSGVLTMSDVPTMRMPRGPFELQAALTQLRVWGLGVRAAATPEAIVAAAQRAGFVDVRTELVGDLTIGPALRFVRDRLDRLGDEVPLSQRLPSRIMLSQVETLWRRGVVDYLLLGASKP
jgi:erythromycin 3''-O-methyltransferase